MKTATKPKTNNAIVKQFFSGVRHAEVNNLRIQNHVDAIALINYETCLLEYEFATKTLHVNKTYYSNPTEKIQNKIRYALRESKLEILKTIEYDNLPRGTSTLFD